MDKAEGKGVRLASRRQGQDARPASPIYQRGLGSRSERRSTPTSELEHLAKRAFDQQEVMAGQSARGVSESALVNGPHLVKCSSPRLGFIFAMLTQRHTEFLSQFLVSSVFSHAWFGSGMWSHHDHASQPALPKTAKNRRFRHNWFKIKYLRRFSAILGGLFRRNRLTKRDLHRTAASGPTMVLV